MSNSGMPIAMISANKKELIIECLPDAIRAARLSSLEAPLVVEELVHIPLDDGSLLDERLRSFAGAKASGLVSGSCAVYPANRIIKRLSIDAPKGKEAEQIIDFLKNDVKVDPDEMQAYCLSASDGHDDDPGSFRKKDVLICGAPKDELSGLQKQLLDNAIYPKSLEIGTVGLIGAVKDALAWSNSKDPLLLLEVEDDFSNALIIGANGVEMSRRIDCGATEIATSLREEMNLKDDEAAEKLLNSDAFDFGSMAAKILRRILRELQSSIGFFEVQTGQSVSRVLTVRRQDNMNWLQDSIAATLNLESWKLDMAAWLESKEVTFKEEGAIKNLNASWLGLVSLMCRFEEGGAS